MNLTFEDRAKMNDIGGATFIAVWGGSKPLGRIRRHDSGFRAFTNKREPGKAFLGTFPTMEEAGARLAHEHGIV